MKSQTITIVGGGITGLSAAFFAQRAMPDAQITVLESSELWGGVLQTESTEGYLIEHSADMFTTDPESAIQICEHLGKTDENQRRRRRTTETTTRRHQDGRQGQPARPPSHGGGGTVRTGGEPETNRGRAGAGMGRSEPS
mgnify:CR=1 FL=1